MTLTLNPGVNPSFTYEPDHQWVVDEVPYIKPYVQKVPRGLRPIRVVRASWAGLTQDQVEYFLSFFHEIKGSAGEFLWTPMDAVFSPLHRGPDLSQVTLAGAPASDRTYYVKFTWYDSATAKETKPSQVSSLLVLTGKVLIITVPIFPAGAPAFRVYAGTAQGSEWAQGHSTVGTWQEPATGLLTTTTLAPSTNTLKPTVKWTLLSSVRPQKISFNRWNLQLEFAELHA